MIRFSSLSSRSQKLAVPLTALALLFFAACEDKHIGRPCELNAADAGSDPTVVYINSEALECPSRLCILPIQAVTTPNMTGPFCTDQCGSDDDCAGGETANKSDTTDHRCQAGFVCSPMIPKLDGIPLSCKNVCVCKDFLVGGKAIPKPEGC